jgi:hypothetical protein
MRIKKDTEFMYEKPHRKRRLILFGIFLVIMLMFPPIYNFLHGKQRSVAGIRNPIQTAARGEKQITRNGYELTLDYKYAYDIEGLVVTTRDYNGSSLEDKLAPKDVGLAWGNVAEYNTQLGFHWVAKKRALGLNEDIDSWGKKQALVGSVEDAMKQYSNNHLVVLDLLVQESIEKIKVGDHVRIKGYLVNIDGDSGNKHYSWHSSTKRDDLGCEVILVESVEWLE